MDGSDVRDAFTGPRHVVVVGGGISGLAAAWFLRRTAGARGPAVTVLEGGPSTGGKLRVSEVAGLPVDEGADALLARRPEAIDLVREVGLGDDLVPAATTAAAVWTRGRLRPLPRGHVMGVPTDLRSLAASGVLTPAGLARLPLDHLLPGEPVSGDVAVGRLVAARLGPEVVDRLVEPLLGGVYAGRAYELSLDATIPALAETARTHPSLLAAARETGRRIGEQSDNDLGAVFAGIRGGLGRLPEALTRALSSDPGARIRTRTTVRDLRRRPDGWRLTVGPTREPESVEADAVVLAVPARPASRLLASDVSSAAAELAAIDYASMALVTLAYPSDAFPEPPSGSGFLVPPVEGRLVKAVTFSSVKWAWLSSASRGVAFARLSIGRYGEERDLQHDDAELVDRAATELGAATGVLGPPVDARVSRWGGALPQYAVGHCDRVARVRAVVAAVPGLAVCGSAYDGVGVAACVASARAAAGVLAGPGGEVFAPCARDDEEGG